VAALAKAFQVVRPIDVARIVIEVCRGEDDTRLSHPGCLLDVRPAGGPTTVIGQVW
jgi:hypothetical protein